MQRVHGSGMLVEACDSITLRRVICLPNRGSVVLWNGVLTTVTTCDTNTYKVYYQYMVSNNISTQKRNEKADFYLMI